MFGNINHGYDNAFGTKDFKQKTSKQLKLYMRNLLKAGAGMILIALFAGGIMHWLKYTFAGYFIENVILSDSELVIFLTVTVIVVVIVLKTLKTIEDNRWFEKTHCDWRSRTGI